MNHLLNPQSNIKKTETSLIMLGIAYESLKNNDMDDQAREMLDRVAKANSNYEVSNIISKYVEVEWLWIMLLTISYTTNRKSGKLFTLKLWAIFTYKKKTIVNIFRNSRGISNERRS